PTIEEGLHPGYRKPRGRRGKPADAGKWVARHYDGCQRYTIEEIGIADDFSDADGLKIFDYWQAQAKAREHILRRAREANGVTGPLTVQGAIETYIEALENDGKNTIDARCRAKAFTTPARCTSGRARAESRAMSC